MAARVRVSVRVRGRPQGVASMGAKGHGGVAANSYHEFTIPNPNGSLRS